MSDIQKIIVPDVGGDEVEVIELCVAVGDTIDADEGVVTVESDKASMDIPAPFEGEVVSLSVAVGDKIKEGDVIGEMKKAGGEEASSQDKEEPAQEAPAPEASKEAPKEESKPEAAPASSGGGEVIEVAVPDIGDRGQEDAIDVLGSVGDTTGKEDGPIKLETDKATMDVPSTHAGTVKEVFISTGDKVNEGTLVIKLETAGSGGAASSDAPAESSSEKAAPAADSSAQSSDSEKSAGGVVEVEVPDIGEDGEVDVIDVLVSVGDTIEKEDGLITLETDKATMDVPSTHAGTVKEVFIKAGQS